MNIRAYNDYIVKTVQNEVNKSVNALNGIIADKVTAQIDSIIAIYKNDTPQHRTLINEFFRLVNEALTQYINGINQNDYNNTGDGVWIGSRQAL